MWWFWQIIIIIDISSEQRMWVLIMKTINEGSWDELFIIIITINNVNRENE